MDQQNKPVVVDNRKLKVLLFAQQVAALNKAMLTLYRSEDTRPRLETSTLQKLQNFFTEAGIVLNNISFMLANFEMVDDDAIKSTFEEICDLTKRAVSITNDVKKIIYDND
jgi:hypothetical protein